MTEIKCEYSFKSLPSAFQYKLMRQAEDKASELLIKNPRVRIIVEL